MDPMLKNCPIDWHIGLEWMSDRGAAEIDSIVRYTPLGQLIPWFARGCVYQLRNHLNITQSQIERDVERWDDSRDYFVPELSSGTISKIEAGDRNFEPYLLYQVMQFFERIIEERLGDGTLMHEEAVSILSQTFNLTRYVSGNQRLEWDDIPKGTGGRILACLLKPLEHLLVGSKTIDGEFRDLSDPDMHKRVFEHANHNRDNLLRLETVIDAIVKTGTLFETIDRTEFTHPQEYPSRLPGVHPNELADLRKIIKNIRQRKEMMSVRRMGPTEPNHRSTIDEAAHEFLSERLAANKDDWLLSEENSELWDICNGKLTYASTPKNTQLTANNGCKVLIYDPLDGSLFYERESHWAISAGLGTWRVEAEEDSGYLDCYAGVIYLPKSQELLIGVWGGGSLVIDFAKKTVRPLFGSGRTNARRAIVMIQLSGQERNSTAVDSFITEYLPNVKDMFERVAGFGVGALTLSEIALGRADGFLCPRAGGSWDTLGGLCVLGAAGGILTDVDCTTPWSVESKGLVAAGNQTIFDSLRFVMRPYASSVAAAESA